MVGSSVQRALVESIHQIGQVMGIRTIAESVEDRATLEALRQIGVDYAQGYGLVDARAFDLATCKARREVSFHKSAVFLGLFRGNTPRVFYQARFLL